MKKANLILKAKEKVAKSHGFRAGIIGTEWEFAMAVTHRTKRQLLLYDDVISLLSDVIIENARSGIQPNGRV